MIVYVLFVVIFLSGGSAVAQSVAGNDLAACEASIDPLVIKLQGLKVPSSDGEQTVIDVQAKCIAVTRQEHA